MSRSNSMMARQIRESESLQTRKAILKAGGSARKQEQAALEAAKADDAFMQKFNELKKFTKKSKIQRKNTTQKSEWIEGETYLLNQAKVVENEISSVFQKIIMSSLSDGRYLDLSQRNEQQIEMVYSELVNSLVSSVDAHRNSREDNQRTVMMQLHDLKNMLKRTKQAINACAARATSASDDAPLSKEEEKRNCAVAVFADVLMQVRNGHREAWVALSEESTRLQQEVNTAALTVSRLQSDRRREAHSLRITEELDEMDDDSVQVLAVLEEWKDKVHSCDEEAQRELSALSAERERVHREYCDACGVDSGEPYGDWGEEDHTIFVKEVKRAQTQGALRQKLSSVLAAQLSHMSAVDISRHEDWYRSLRSIADRKKLASQSYEQRRETLLVEAKASLETARKRAKDDAALAEELARQERARAELHQLLNLQRLQRVNDMQSRLAEIEQLRVQADEEQRRQEDKRQAELRHKKALAEQFKADRAVYVEAERVREERRAQEEAEARRRHIDANKGHVQQREAMRLQKLEENRRKEAAMLEEEARRIDMLNRLAEQVPYFDALQNASSKLDHVTVATEAQKYHKPDEETRGFLALNGFTDKRIFKDARFRLGLALREAGVHQSAAAAAVISAMHPRAMAPW